MIIRHKIELILNNSMKRYFDQCFGYSRYMWNMLLGMHNENHTKSLNEQLTEQKRNREKWEYAMPSYIPAFEMRNLKKTLKAKHTKHKANFKSKKHTKLSFYVPNDRIMSDSFRPVGNGKRMTFGIYVGAKCRVRKQDRWMKLTENPAFFGEDDFKIMSATILKEVDRYYVSFCISIDHCGFTTGTGEVGIDPGVHAVMSLSTGKVYKLPKALWYLEEKIKRYQRQMSKRYKRSAKQSKRYEKAKIKHQKTLRRKNRIKNDFMQKATTEIVKENKYIAWEDCKPSRLMKNHKLAHAIQESCWCTLKTMLQLKCQMHGATFDLVSPLEAATQTCSNEKCNHRFTGENKLTLKDRVFKCPECGLELDRDVNAARNILKFSKRKLAGAQPSK